MEGDVTYKAIEILVGVVCVLMVPFAIKVTWLLSEIKTTLTGMEWQEKAIADHRNEINALKIELERKVDKDQCETKHENLG